MVNEGTFPRGSVGAVVTLEGSFTGVGSQVSVKVSFTAELLAAEVTGIVNGHSHLCEETSSHVLFGKLTGRPRNLLNVSFQYGICSNKHDKFIT